APVRDLHFDPVDNLLIVATLGRGAWTIPNASAVLTVPAELKIDGDMDRPDQDDNIVLLRNAAKPWMLDVFVNRPTTEAPSFSVRLSTVQRIVVNGLGGNDKLVVDSSNGPIAVSGGIVYDGGASAGDVLQLQGGS